MALDTNNTQAYLSANPPATDGSMCCWYRREVDNANVDTIAGFGGTVANMDIAEVSNTDLLRGNHANLVQTASLLTETTGVWRYVFLSVVAGSGADGVMTIKYLNDGDTTFQGTEQITLLTNLGWTDLLINTNQNGAGGGFSDALFAFVKFFNVVISDADAITERSYRHNQTGNQHATYKFASGALTTDTGPNAYTLTGVGSGGTYVATEPTAILGDNPGAAKHQRRRDFMSYATLAAPALEVFGRIFTRSKTGLMLPQGV